MNYEVLRSDFPILSQIVNGFPLIYVDNAATTQKPRAVLDALMQFYTTTNANVYRGTHSFSESATYEYEQVRKKVATFINASAEEIVFTAGCTAGINAVAEMFGEVFISPGDEIVLTELEHHSNFLPWLRVAEKRGAMLKYIPVLPDGTLDLSCLENIITSKTKLVSMIHVSNAVGTCNDIKTIILCAKAVGAYTLVDAAQSIAHKKIDVRELGCDFLVFSGHKILGPTGVGVLFIDKKLHDQLPPYQVGGGMVDHVSLSHVTWARAPHKFEAGTPPIAQVIGLGAALDYLSKNVSFNDLMRHEVTLTARLIDGLSTFKKVRLLGPLAELKQKGHLVSFLVEGCHGHDVAAFLDSRGIAVRAGHHCAQPFAAKLGYDASVRVSFYFYNTIKEVDAIVEAVSLLVK